MLYWSVVFLLIALLAAIFGYGGLASAAGGTARVLFSIFLVMFVVSLILGLSRKGHTP